MVGIYVYCAYLRYTIRLILVVYFYSSYTCLFVKKICHKIDNQKDDKIRIKIR